MKIEIDIRDGIPVVVAIEAVRQVVEEGKVSVGDMMEQMLIPKFKVGDRIYDKRDSYNRNVIREVGKDYYINAFAQKMDMAYTDANFEFLEHLDNDLIDSKPAEWSEEDKLNLNNAILAAQKEWGAESCTVKFLKSLRPQPHWKPSEYTLSLVKK